VDVGLLTGGIYNRMTAAFTNPAVAGRSATFIGGPWGILRGVGETGRNVRVLAGGAAGSDIAMFFSPEKTTFLTPLASMDMREAHDISIGEFLSKDIDTLILEWKNEAIAQKNKKLEIINSPTGVGPIVLQLSTD